MRSVVVVLPASMCAAMPMLRVHSRGNGRSLALTGETLALSVTTVMAGEAALDMITAYLLTCDLPAEVSKSAIRLSHLVGIFFFLNDTARVVVGIDDLGRERFLHRNALARSGCIDDPAKRQALLTFVRNFNRHLIGRA